MGQLRALIPIFCVKQALLLFYFWRFGRIGLGTLGLIFALNLQLLQLSDLIVLLAQTMSISDVDVDPTSSVSNSHSPRPHQVAQTRNTVDEGGAFLLANLIHRHSFSRD